MSDKPSETERTASEIRALLNRPFDVTSEQVVAAEQAIIRSKLRVFADQEGLELVLTTGGTGLALRDNTPEATREVIDREIPGVAELMRLMGMQKDRRAALGRGVCGVRRRTLIVNLPDSAKEVKEALAAIVGILPGAVEGVAAQPSSAPHL